MEPLVWTAFIVTSDHVSIGYVLAEAIKWLSDYVARDLFRGFVVFLLSGETGLRCLSPEIS